MNLSVSIVALVVSVMAFALEAYIYTQVTGHAFFLLALAFWALISGFCLCWVIQNLATKPVKLLNVTRSI